MGLEEREKTVVSFNACTAMLMPSQPSRLADIMLQISNIIHWIIADYIHCYVDPS